LAYLTSFLVYFKKHQPALIAVISADKLPIVAIDCDPYSDVKAPLSSKKINKI
jgi:hypothetical protein